MDNFDNLTLWKETFPPNSWIMKGFGIVILFDVSVENALSNLKSNLLRSEPDQIVRGENIENIFRSIFKVPDLKVGFTPYIQEENKFKMVSSKDKFTSFILLDSEEADCKNALCGCSFETLMEAEKVLQHFLIFPNFQKVLQTKLGTTSTFSRNRKLYHGPCCERQYYFRNH